MKFILILVFTLVWNMAGLAQSEGTNSVKFGDIIVAKKQMSLASYTFNPIAISYKKAPQSLMYSNKTKMAVFCRVEHEVAQSSGFNIKFRLGDQDYVDRLEGKAGSRLLVK